jgi:hypothetical protein
LTIKFVSRQIPIVFLVRSKVQLVFLSYNYIFLFSCQISVFRLSFAENKTLFIYFLIKESFVFQQSFCPIIYSSQIWWKAHSRSCLFKRTLKLFWYFKTRYSASLKQHELVSSYKSLPFI